MAILGKIRRSSAALIGLIGLALFAFIISGLIKNAPALFQPSREYVGKVNGEPIPTKEFQTKMANLQKQYGPRYSNMQVMKMVWDDFVRQKLLESEFHKAGIIVPDDRVYEKMKNDPGIRRMFTNEQGVFDENAFINYLENINSAKEENPDAYQAWTDYQNQTRKAEGEKIFRSLINAAIQPSIEEGKWEYHRQNDKVDFKFVVVPYSSIPDSTVQITEADVEKYIKEHSEQYKTKESRDIAYVKFQYVPSAEDYKNVKEKTLELINGWEVLDNQTNQTKKVPGFKDTEDIEGFIKQYSDKVLPVRWYNLESLPKDVKDTLSKLPKGAVYGPVLKKQAYYVYRIVDRLDSIPKTAKASHILIAYQGSAAQSTLTKEEAKKKADSLLAVLKRNPKKFAELAKQYSDDPGSKTKGGDLGEFSFDRMVEPFSKFVFTHKKGDIGLVETRYGYHIIKVDDQSKKKTSAVKLAQLIKEVEPSETTLDSIYTKAAEFQLKVKKLGDINEAAKEIGTKAFPVKKIHKYESHLPGLNDQPRIVTWLFDKKTKKGDVKRFETEEGYVIVQYLNETPEGLMPVSEAMVLVKPILLNKKKFEMVKDKLTGNNLDEIAKKSGGQTGEVKGASIDSPYIPGLGKEPKVVAVALIVPESQISKPIEGKYGAYVVQPVKKEIAPDIKSYAAFVEQVKQREEKRAYNEAVAALKKKAKIKDNRQVIGY